MNNITHQIISDSSPYDVPFFYDFMLILERLRKQPIKCTITGAISLTDIQDLISQFKEQERIREYKEFGWRLHREEELDFLTQIKFIAEVMFLTYKRRGLTLLTKNGKSFLDTLDASKQYQEMILHYWYEVNWGYFTPGHEIGNYNLAETLQHYQKGIWQALLEKGLNWVDYKEFCHMICSQLHLTPYMNKEFDPYLFFEINLILFKRNLERLGCVEVIKEKSEHAWEEIIKFRSTPLGLGAYHRALFKNYL